MDFAPLTILVGPNNSGKTALAQAIQLVAGGLAPSDGDVREPLPLESGGIRHGESFADLVTGRAVHGRLRFSVTLAGERGALSLSATVTNVVAPGQPSERQVSDWRLKSDHGEIHAERQGFGAGSDTGSRSPGGELDPGSLLSQLGTDALGYVWSNPDQSDTVSSPANRLFVDSEHVGQALGRLSELDELDDRHSTLCCLRTASQWMLSLNCGTVTGRVCSSRGAKS